MPRNKQTARKLTGGKRARELKEEIQFSWVFYMVRLIHKASDLNVDGPVTAHKVMLIFDEIEDIYGLFGLDKEPDQKPYINIGVQKRDWHPRVDVYILVGLKIRQGVHPDINIDMIEQWDGWFCKPLEPESDDEDEVIEVVDNSLDLDEHTVHIVQGDERQVYWLDKIIDDMEDNASTIDDIYDIING